MLAAHLPLVRRLYELGLPLLLLVVALRSGRTRGWRLTGRELLFGFALSQAVELLAVGLGRYDYPDWLVYFPPWPRFVPLGIALAWCALVPVLMRVSERILGPGASPWRLAALDGAMAVGLDRVLDPAVSGEPLRMWLWQGPAMTPYRYWVLGVPVFNFVGWFLLVGACSIQLRLAEKRPTAAARGIFLSAMLVLDLAIAAAVMQLPW
ncbi:MAG: carotenoid biosynthesis protein [Myxococcaceae bacterium]